MNTAWAALRRIGDARVLFAPVLTESRLEGGIRTVEARLAWLDDALAEIASDAWRRLPPG